MWMTQHRGKLVTLPIDFGLDEPPECRMPNKVLMTIDEVQFKDLLANNAVWTTGKGPFLVLAYCRELTITRHQTLNKATEAKKTIDHSGCGGACLGVHIIAFCDPDNGRRKARTAAIDQYLVKQAAKAANGSDAALAAGPQAGSGSEGSEDL
jgi:hypothetical protein